jgi:hypothetical protein
MDEKPLPYLTAALFCEKILQEVDGSVSVIRIADRVQLKASIQGMSPEAVKELNLLATLHGIICLKSGDVVGDFTINIAPTSPSGKKLPVAKAEVTLNGGMARARGLYVDVQST